MTLFIHLFGQPRLLLDDQILRLSAPPKTLPLLAYLLLHRSQAVERKQVAFAFWPDDPETAARANLRRHLHHLLHALPPAPTEQPWLFSDSETIRWNPQADFWLDVAEFERLSALPEALAEAAERYSGDLLETVYDDWVFFERERLRNQYFDVMAQLVLQHRAKGSYARAIHYAQQILARDPFREDFLRQLVALRYEAGDRAGALKEYEAFEQRLRQEMGVAPMPETQALHQAVLRNARLPGLETRGSNAGHCADTLGNRHLSNPATHLPFVGRETEMSQAMAWWNRAVHEHGSLVLLGGEVGVGKTRLAREIALQVESQGGRILHGTTAPNEPRAYQPVVEALESALPLISALDMDPMRLAVLGRLIPEIGRRRQLPGPPRLEAEQERLRLFDAVAWALEKLAEPRPLLVVLEDLHWAGEGTSALIEFLARRATSHPLLLLGTYREEETPRAHPLRLMRRRLQRDCLVEHLALSRLSPQAIDCLLERLSNEAMLPAAIQKEDSPRLYAESEGNPLLVDLLLQHWRECGPGSLPDGIHSTITRRLERLSANARALAEIGAVIGPAFEVELVREVGGWDESQVLDSLGELLDQRLISDAESRSRFDYTFTHHLVQAALYSSIPAAKRRRRHHRVAEVIEDLYPERLSSLAGSLAYHYDQGGEPARAISYYRNTGRQRLEVFADSEALSALDRALVLAQNSTAHISAQIVFDLLLLRERIYHRRGERAKQQADLLRMEHITAAADGSIESRQRMQCEALRQRIAYDSVLGERPAEAAAIQQLQTLANQLGDAGWQAQAQMAQGNYLLLVCQYPQAQACLEQSLALYRSLDDVDGQVACYCLLADVAVQQGRFNEVQDALDQANQLALTDGDQAQKDGMAYRSALSQSNQALMARSMRAASGALFARQDFPAAEAMANQWLALCRSIGDREGEADALSRLAAVAARRFQVQQARSYYAEAGQIYNTLGKRQGQAAVMVNTTMLLVGRLGHYSEGLSLTRQAMAIFQALGDVRGQAICALNEGMIALYLEDYAAGRAASQCGLELARQMNSRVMEANALANLGAAERELGDLEAAIEHMESGLAIRRTLDQPAELGTDLCDLTVAYCRIGRLDQAKQAAEEMLALYNRFEESMMHPQYILWAAAQVKHACGETQQAQALLDRACAVMHRQAEALPETASRESYYRLPFNRQILSAIQLT